MKKLTFLLTFVLLPLSIFSADKTSIVVETDAEGQTISRHLYGHFAEHLGRCIYEGIWVGEDSDIPNINGYRKGVVEALKEIDIPNLRWPGGCFADEYHWKDGIGPKDERPPMINTHWGMISEDNSFGTHEFLSLCEMLDCEPIIAGNMGSGTVKELNDWVEYVNADIETDMTRLRKKNGKEKAWHVKYWGVGNESWGCGGNMNPTQYYEKMCRYSTYIRSYPDKPVYKVAVGPSGFNLDWTDEFMRNVAEDNRAHLFDGYSLHLYTFPGDWSDKGSATDFNEEEWFKTLKNSLLLDKFIDTNASIIDKHLPNADIDLVVDEWGTWYNPEEGKNAGFLYQQNTLRDALVAGISLNIFNNNNDRVKIANIAQTVNVLQAMLLTNEEEVVHTPTWYVYKMFKPHHDATWLPIQIESAEYSYEDKSFPAVNASASKNDAGIHISLTNADPNNSQEVECDLQGAEISDVTGEILTADKMNARNEFGKEEKVMIKSFDQAKIENNKLIVTLPPKSVVMLELQ